MDIRPTIQLKLVELTRDINTVSMKYQDIINWDQDTSRWDFFNKSDSKSKTSSGQDTFPNSITYFTSDNSEQPRKEKYRPI